MRVPFCKELTLCQLILLCFVMHKPLHHSAILKSGGFPSAPEEQEVVENMKKLMAKVEEMQKQRETLEAQLRDQVHNDDITTSLVVQEGDKEVSVCEVLSMSFH